MRFPVSCCSPSSLGAVTYKYIRKSHLSGFLNVIVSGKSGFQLEVDKDIPVHASLVLHTNVLLHVVTPFLTTSSLHVNCVFGGRSVMVKVPLDTF